MILKSILSCERDKLEKLSKYQLPNYFKKIGVGLFIFSLIALFVNRFTINDFEIKVIIKYGMLIGLLFTSISKEKIEDELFIKLKMQSYTFAFIAGVCYVILLPFVDFLFDFILGNKEAMLKDVGDWQILFLLLSIQVFYFEFLKKLYK